MRSHHVPDRAAGDLVLLAGRVGLRPRGPLVRDEYVEEAVGVGVCELGEGVAVDEAARVADRLVALEAAEIQKGRCRDEHARMAQRACGLDRLHHLGKVGRVLYSLLHAPRAVAPSDRAADQAGEQ